MGRHRYRGARRDGVGEADGRRGLRTAEPACRCPDFPDLHGMTDLFRSLAVAAFVLLTPLPASAQVWTVYFTDGQTVLSPEGYRIAGEIAALAIAEPRHWEFTVGVSGNDAGVAPIMDYAGPWRMRAVLLELAERGVDICRLTSDPGVFGPQTPITDGALAGRIVIQALRVPDDPTRSCHRDRPVVYFESGSAEVSAEGRFLLAASIAGPALRGVRARVEAFADTAGDPAANLRLSQSRANSVARELFRLGIPWARIETRALGEMQLAVPSADSVSEAGNRRAWVWLRWDAAPAR